MLTKDELAKKVLHAVKGDAEAVKAVSSALISGNRDQIRSTLARVAGVHLLDEELDMILRELGANPAQAVVAYST